MKLTVLGGQGAWPTVEAACSGYLLQTGDNVVLLDPGYGTMRELSRYVDPAAIDAVVVSHRHPDHCADLNPLLRYRALSRDVPPPVLRVYAPADALAAVLSLDTMRATSEAVAVTTVRDGDHLTLGPLAIEFAALPHHVPNLGVRVSDAHSSLAYTGDSGPDNAVIGLARDADLLLIEATCLDAVPDEDLGYLCDVRTAIEQGREAAVAATVLTHLWPGLSPDQARTLGRSVADESVDVAVPGFVRQLGLV